MRLFVISGLTDVEKSGNQSFKNTLKYLALDGLELTVFTLLPSDYHNLADPLHVFMENRPRYHRLPAMLVPFMKLGRYVKDTVGKWGRRAVPDEATESTDHFDEYNLLGRSLYLVLLFAAVGIEFVRVGVASLRRRPDVYYGVNGQGALCASILGRIFRRPVVTRFHGTVLQEADLASWRRRLYKLDESLPMRAYADLQIMTDDGTRGQHILRLMQHRVRRQVFWRNGVDLDSMRLGADFDRDAFRHTHWLADRFVLLMASRLTMWKRVDRGVEVLAELRRRLPRLSATLVIAGDGPARGALEQFARTRGVEGNVRFLGDVPHNELTTFFAASDVFMSLYDISNLANPVYEALHSGLPIVSLRDGTTNGLLVDGVNAFLCEPSRFLDDAVEGLQRLFADASLRRRYGAASRDIAATQLRSWRDRVAMEHEELKRLVLSRSSNHVS